MRFPNTGAISWKRIGPKTFEIKCRSMLDGTITYVVLPEEKFNAFEEWNRGNRYIQDVPVSDTIRETLFTGLTFEQQEGIFKEPEE